jgi:hypothetical protein
MPKSKDQRELCHIFVNKKIFSISDLTNLIGSLVGGVIATIRINHLNILKVDSENRQAQPVRRGTAYLSSLSTSKVLTTKRKEETTQ